MTDRPTPDAEPPASDQPAGAVPEPDPPANEPPAVPVSGAPTTDPVADPGPPAGFDLGRPDEPSGGSPIAPPPVPEAPVQVPPAPFAASDPEPEPRPEPSLEPAPQTGTAAEPRATVTALPEPVAPGQPAPESGQDASAPPDSAEAAEVPESPTIPVGFTPGTEETLALPPTTKEVEPPSVSSAPPPPSGVPVPFAAPPIERNSGRFTLKLVLSLVGGVVLVGGVIVAIVAALVVFTNSITDKVEATAADFIAEVAEEDWSGAHALLCDDLRQQPAESFISEWEAWDAENAQVGPIGGDGTEVQVRFADGTTIALAIEVDDASETLDMSVCGWREL